MNLKEPLSIKQQISKLKEHGMTVPDINNAEHFLSKINYYRFSGYAIEYRKSPHDSNYVTGANFDAVCRIYCFDEQIGFLRNDNLIDNQSSSFHKPQCNCNADTPPSREHK